MATFIYRCPTTGLKVQGWVADDAASEDDKERYVALPCLACRESHLINPTSGKVLGAEEE
jgi:hypothetical protein